MLKALLWTVTAAMSGAAAVFVPIDPAVLYAVGFTDAASRQFSARRPAKIVSQPVAADNQSALLKIDAPVPSPYGAGRKIIAKPAVAPSDRIGQLAIASPPQLAVRPAIATPPAATVPVAVVRGLQTELRRVGCYNGRIDGDWGPASRFAMASFVKSVNAALPTERPDAILLSLVRRHPGGACGNSPTANPTLITAATAVTKARVGRLSGWQARVAPAAQSAPRRVRQPIRLTGAPRIVRSGGGNSPSLAIAAAPPLRNGLRPSPFADRRMSLGVAVPAPAEARRPITSPNEAAPNSYVRRQTRFKRTERRFRRSAPRARRANVKRRRYYRRRARSRSWRRSVFPGVYN